MARTLSPANRFAVALVAAQSLLLFAGRTAAEGPRDTAVAPHDANSSAIINPFAKTPAPVSTTRQPISQQQPATISSQGARTSRPAATSFRNPFSTKNDAPRAEASLLPGPRSRWRNSPAQYGAADRTPSPATSATSTANDRSMPGGQPIILRLNPPLTATTPDAATATSGDASPAPAAITIAEPEPALPPATPVIRIPPLKRPPTPPEPTSPRPSSLSAKSAIVAAGANLPAEANPRAVVPQEPLLCDTPDTSTVQIIAPRARNLPRPTHSAVGSGNQPVQHSQRDDDAQLNALRIKSSHSASDIEQVKSEQPRLERPNAKSTITLPTRPVIETLAEPAIISDYDNSPSSWLVDAQETAQTARTINELSTVIRRCELVINANPGNNLAPFARRLAAWAHNRRGELLIEADQAADALDQFQAAIELDPQNSLAIHNRAVTLAQQNDFDAALIDFNRVIELNPGLAIAYRNRGELLAAQGKLDDAIADYSRAIESLPDDAELRRARAHALQQQDQFELARSDLDRSIQIAPNEAPGYTQRANLFADRCEYPRAIQDFNQALAIEPKLADAHRGLAWIKATCPDERLRDASQALEAAHAAVQLSSPDDYLALDVLAAAHANAGEFDEAIAAQQQAINTAPPEAGAPMQARLNLYEQGQPYRVAR